MIDKVAGVIKQCFRDGNKVVTFGVGGNAANASHFAAELAGKFEHSETCFPCVCLNDNVSVLTAITNDFGWEHVFERQIKGLVKPGDVLIAFSIGTNGDYLRNALFEAILRECSAIVLICGKMTRPFNPQVLLHYIVWELGSEDTPWVQEEQLRLIHELCRKVKF